MDQQEFLARDFVKNTASADADQLFDNIYVDFNRYYVRAWRMPVSSDDFVNTLSLVAPFSAYRVNSSIVHVRIHVLVRRTNDASGYVRFRMFRDVVFPVPEVALPNATLGTSLLPLADSDEVFITEPAAVTTGRDSLAHYMFSFSLPSSPFPIPNARFFVGIERVTPTLGPEYPEPVYFEYMTVYFHREYNLPTLP